VARIKGRALKAPVHLILHGETLYIGASGTGSILALDLTSTPPSGKLEARVVIDGKLVHQHLGDMKTETSEKPVPMAVSLATEMRDWRRLTAYSGSEDWIFASPKMKGSQPYWPETLMRCFVKPALKHLGINKRVGWHTFRRTLATLLRSAAEDVKTTQELMRHANSRMTLDVYAQALTPAKRTAHQKVVEMIWQVTKPEVVPTCSRVREAVSVSA
jgi:integrase